MPATFEQKWEDSPAYGNYPGKDDKVEYKEGVFVGYRWFDEKNIEPRFPFGFGLSYTTFQISNLKVSSSGGQYQASVDIVNTGPKAGSDVVQFYVGEDTPRVPRPPRQLVAFARIELKPGETKTANVTIDPSTFAYWDSSQHHWKVDQGKYHIWAGDSSRSLPVNAAFEYR